MFNRGHKAAADQAKAPEPLVAVDIGTSKIRLIEGLVDSENIVSVSYFDEVPSAGIVNGTVSDLEKLTEKLSILIHNYEKNTGGQFSRCFVGIAGRHIQSKNEKGNATVPSHRVTAQDKENAIAHARSAKFSEYSHLLHVIPQSYDIDGTGNISNPIDLSAMRLGVDVHLIACNEDQENNLRAAFEKLSSQFQIEHVIYNGVAAADAVLSQEEKDIGVCLIDFGAGAINVAVYDQSRLVLTFGLDVGGNSVTRDIATHFGVSLPTAEYLKLNYGVAHPALLPPEVQNEVLSFPNGNQTAMIPRHDLSTLVGLCLIDIFRTISDRIERYRQNSGKPLSIGAGYVITGGAACTSGITILATNKLGAADSIGHVKVKTAVPRGVKGDYEALELASSATAVGLLRFGNAINLEQSNRVRNLNANRNSTSVVGRAISWTRDWLSKEF
ncbi:MULTISPECIES: cell division protein FtsA [unclassified Anaerobiospirillum]|uniref:cell division protein FtsA n=1 Tax=unclassified Anaerobiospirillum TaxID=2647410 RepID=UPI001FF1C74B|nr:MULTISPECIES: cell division protein FtsA [unclassified Anaerobiospirillum]MCK0526303.1 cell division protein FtsA [Anaerobiospirillum sp. NML120449]MCK0535318.1 cell division protein FtsA [Anaerobiospirillum sp. NML120511]MCK0540487.1 cell division protein FtsA [Anaerobiospirillum sp. NML02-A-032]